MAGMGSHINVDVNFYTDKCVTNTHVSSGQHFFFLAGTNGVNPKEMARYISIESLLCSFLTTEETFNYFSLSIFLKYP